MSSANKTRTRRPKKRPPFYKTDNTEIKIPHLNVKIYRNGLYKTESKILEMTPYSKYIPLYYVITANSDHFPILHHSLSYHETAIKQYHSQFSISRFPSNLAELLCYVTNIHTDYELRKSATKLVARNWIRAFLQMDSIIGLNVHYRGGTRISDALESFESSNFNMFSMKSYSLHAGLFSTVVDNRPLIMAVVRQKDYLYFRTCMLLNKPIDLSRVIILVDRRLDMPIKDDIPNAFRNLYTQNLEPTIRSTPASIFKVPLEYIQENCFLPKFEIKSRRKDARMAEIEEFAKAWKLKLGFKEKSTAVDVLRTEPDDYPQVTATRITIEVPERVANIVNQLSDMEQSMSSQIRVSEYRLVGPPSGASEGILAAIRHGSETGIEQVSGRRRVLNYAANQYMSPEELAVMNEMTQLREILAGGAPDTAQVPLPAFEHGEEEEVDEDWEEEEYIEEEEEEEDDEDPDF